MYVSRVPAGLLERLDAEYYNPDALEVVDAVCAGAHRRFGECVQSGHYGVIKDSSEKVEAGHAIPLLAPTDLDEYGHFTRDHIQTQVPRSCASRSPDAVVSYRDLLLEAKGNTAKAAVISKADHGSCLASGSFFKATLVESFDPWFSWAFWTSRPGQVLKRRIVANTNISYLSKPELYAIPVPTPAADVQECIGNKVRQAEALRAAGRALVERVDNYHRHLVPSESRQQRKVWTRIGASRLTERVDAEFYPGAVDAYFAEWSGEVQQLEDLCETLYSGTTLPETAGRGISQATVANLSPTFIEPELRRVRSKAHKKRIRNHDLLICAAAHTASYIGKDITYATVGDEIIVPSTEVLLVRPDRQRVPSSYIRAYLKSPTGYRQIQACVRGISAHLYPSDLSVIRVPVPQVPTSQREEWFGLDDIMLRAAERVALARSLVEAARMLVEALIERKVSEADLIHASNNPAADRELLERLTTGGLDADGDPLFPDLDRLNELLAEAHGEGSE